MISEFCCSRSFCDVMMFNAHAWSVGTSELEGREFGHRVLSVINGELCQSQPIHPTFLLFCAEQSQVLLYFPIHNLCLTICLWVMHCRKLGRDPELLAKVRHDLQGKLQTPITNDGARETMILPDMKEV